MNLTSIIAGDPPPNRSALAMRNGTYYVEIPNFGNVNRAGRPRMFERLNRKTPAGIERANKVIAMKESGEGLREIASTLGITTSAVRKILELHKNGVEHV